jgi:hypothetical protein
MTLRGHVACVRREKPTPYNPCQDLVELARICARNARLPETTKAASSELWNMAKEYRERAAQRQSSRYRTAARILDPAVCGMIGVRHE